MKTGRNVTVACVTVAAAVVLLYGTTVGYGIDWDDYHFLHHYSWSEVTKGWTGSWDRTGIEAPFYRPVTVAFFALRSTVLGLNTTALHVLSVVLAVLAGLTGLRWLTAMGYGILPATVGVLALLMHPAMALAGPLWITNQMHLLQLIVVLSALTVAAKSTNGWPVILALQIIGLLIKEDSAMLSPVIASMWWLKGCSVPRPWIVATGVAFAAWLLVRTLALSGVGGYQSDVTGAPLVNVLSVLLWMAMPTGNIWPASLVTLGVVLVLLAWRGESFAFQTALLMALCFVAPLALARGLNRGHLVMLPVALVIAELVSRPPARLRAVAVIPALVLIGWWSVVSHTVILGYAPCSTVVRQHDADVRTWIADGHVDPDTAEILTAKACR